MDDTNQSKQPSSPANYVTILELKERWLKAKEQKEKEEKELKEKEQQEEELRQRKLKQEEEKQRNLNAVVQVTETDSKFRIPNIRTRFRPANRGVSEPEGGAELEGKSEGPEEKKNLGKKKKKWGKKKKKNVRAEKEEVVADKEGTVHAPPEASSEEKLNEAAIGNEERKGIDIQIRANSENVGSAEEIGQKFGDLSVKGETEKRDGRLSKVDKRGNGEIWGYRRLGLRQRGIEQVWVKKGEVFNGNVDGVQSSERSDAISGQTGTTLNARSLKLAGKISESNPRQWKRTIPKKVYGPVKL